MLDSASSSVKSTNPFNVPGTPIARLGQKSDTRIKLVVAAVVVATVFLFSGLFIQGCQRQPTTGGASGDTQGAATTPDLSGTAIASTPAATNTVGTATTDAVTTNATAASSPFPSDSATPATSALPTKDYVVVKGDSFYKIAKANHITTKALTDANPGVDSKLKIGQTLHVPQAPETAATTPAGSTTATTPATSASASAGTDASSVASAKPAGTGEKKYVVKSGDTLGRIAKAHGTTVKAIKSANGLTSDRIAVGKTLKLPQGKSSTGSAV